MTGVINRLLSHDDAGKLLLRLAVGGLMLFHGIGKLLTGAAGIKGLLASFGLPEFIAYGTYFGEIVAPVFIILGILTRPSALLVSFTMVVAWLMIGVSGEIFGDEESGLALIQQTPETERKRAENDPPLSFYRFRYDCCAATVFIFCVLRAVQPL